MEACLIEPALDECAVTDDAGRAELSVPASAQVAVRASAGSMQTVILQGTTGETDALVLDAYVPSSEVIDAFNAIIGVETSDPELGTVAIAEVEDLAPGYFPSDAPLFETAVNGGHVSYEFESAGTWGLDPFDLPAPEDAGIGSGFVAGVPAGRRTIRYDGNYVDVSFGAGGPPVTEERVRDCSAVVYGWPGEEPGEVVALVEPGTLTLTAAACVPPDREVSARATDYVDQAPLQDVEVCLIEPPGPCERTSETGQALLRVPGGARYALRFTAEGRLPTIVQSVAVSYDVQARLPTMDIAQRFDALVGSPGQGRVAFEAPQGARVSADDSGARTVFLAEGVFFQPDPALEASVGNGAWLGPLPPGEHVLHYGFGDRDCPRPSLGWPGDAPGDVVVLVEPGAVTMSGLRCE